VNAAKSDDFVVVGYLRAKNGGKGFSALLLAQYREGELMYAGESARLRPRDFKAIEPKLRRSSVPMRPSRRPRSAMPSGSRGPVCR
jgi:ATP-dependent DNA ligase